MAVGTQIVLPLVTCLRRDAIKLIFADAFQDLMQFGKMINVIIKLAVRSVLCNLNVNLNNKPGLVSCVDLTFAPIAGVMDH